MAKEVRQISSVCEGGRSSFPGQERGRWMKRSGVQCREREGWGSGEQGGRERGGGGEEYTGSLWRVENQQEVTPLGLEDQYYSCQHSLAATVCGHWSFSSHSLIHLGIWGLRCTAIQGNSIVAT